MAKRNILLIEDDPDIIELVRYNLEREGYACAEASDGESGLRLARETAPDLVLLDLMLPGISGLDVCRTLRSEEATRLLPIIMLTAKSEESDVVSGLELGADDYVPKPFSPRELIARIRTVLRRYENEESAGGKSRLQVDGVTMDATRHEVRVDGELVVFTRAEFRLLWALATKPGRVFTRNDLLDFITDGEAIILDRNVDVHVSAIRKKLGPHGALVTTVRGIGYKCKDD